MHGTPADIKQVFVVVSQVNPVAQLVAGAVLPTVQGRPKVWVPVLVVVQIPLRHVNPDAQSLLPVVQVVPATALQRFP